VSTAPGDYLTTQQVAQALNVTLRTVQRLVKSGKLPVAKRGARGVALISYSDAAILLSTHDATPSNLREVIQVLAQRVHVLEQRVSRIESLLDMTPTQLVTARDTDPDELRHVLIELNTRRRWGITEITDVLGDMSRIADDVAEIVGAELVRTTLERVIVEARLLRHSRSELYVGRAKLIMLRLNVQAGAAEEHLALGL